MFKKYLLLIQLKFRGISSSIDIARAFHTGNYVDKDLELAEVYYRSAIDEGDISAYGFVANLFFEKDNYADAYYHYGKYCELTNEIEDARNFYRKAAGYGSLEATHKLAVLLSQAEEMEALSYYRHAVAKSYEPALHDFIEWSDSNAQASFCLGQMYHDQGELNGLVDLQRAWVYYQRVLNLCHYDQSVSLVAKALSGLRDICEKKKDVECWLELSLIYKAVFNDHSASADCATQAINAQAIFPLYTFDETNNYYGHLIGLAYEKNSGDDALINAWNFYLIAAKKGVLESLSKIKEMALSFNKASHWLELGGVYKKLKKDAEAVDCFNYAYHIDKNQTARNELLVYINQNTDYAYTSGSWHEGLEDYETALFFHFIAAKAKNEKALLAIRGICEKVPSNSSWIKLGDIYAHPFMDNVSALECFKKASPDNMEAIAKIHALATRDSHCACMLGLEEEEKNTNEALLKAWSFYLIAAKSDYEEGLLGLERISYRVSKIDNILVALEMGRIYQHIIQDNLKALDWFQSANDPNHPEITNALQVLVQSDAECAYRMGLYYLDKGDKDKAYTDFIYAIKKQHAEATRCLNQLADEGDAQAQFYLGFHYHHGQGQYQQAVDRCIQASTQHEQALNYLMSMGFPAYMHVYIGKKYEEGNMVAENLDLAYFFYKKAYAFNNKHSALYLAQLLVLEDFKAPTNEDQDPITYLFAAARYGCADALPMLHRLAEDADSPTKQRLGDLYNNKEFCFFNPQAAACWHEKAYLDNYNSANTKGCR